MNNWDFNIIWIEKYSIWSEFRKDGFLVILDSKEYILFIFVLSNSKCIIKLIKNFIMF